MCVVITTSGLLLFQDLFEVSGGEPTASEPDSRRSEPTLTPAMQLQLHHWSSHLRRAAEPGSPVKAGWACDRQYVFLQIWNTLVVNRNMQKTAAWSRTLEQ